jgi:hypothetical protein
MRGLLKISYFILFFLSGCNNLSKNKKDSLLVNDLGPEIIKNTGAALLGMPSIAYCYPGLTDKDARESLSEPLKRAGNAIFPDTHYIRIKYQSFVTFSDWFQKITSQLNNEEIGDGYDCDNYSFLYKSLLSVSSYKNQNLREVLVGVIYVNQKHSFGGIPSGQFYHALNIICTESGWYVYEPQTGEFDKIENYPNNILWFIF